MDEQYSNTLDEQLEWKRINDQEAERKRAVEENPFYQAPIGQNDVNSLSVDDISKILNDGHKDTDIEKLRKIREVLKKTEMQQQLPGKTLVKKRYPPTMAGYVDALVLASIVGFMFGLSIWICLLIIK